MDNPWHLDLVKPWRVYVAMESPYPQPINAPSVLLWTQHIFHVSTPTCEKLWNPEDRTRTAACAACSRHIHPGVVIHLQAVSVFVWAHTLLLRAAARDTICISSSLRCHKHIRGRYYSNERQIRQTLCQNMNMSSMNDNLGICNTRMMNAIF